MAKKTATEVNKETTEHIAKKREAKKRAVRTTRKVYHQAGKGEKTIPKILIEGAFLGEFGFKVGDSYEMTLATGIITLKKI